MKTYRSFARALEQLLGGETAVRIHVEPYMPLAVEEIGPADDGRRLVALSHTSVQNGDLMRDPEIVFAFFDAEAAEPVSFRNDYAGVCNDVYVYGDDGRRTGVYPDRKAELKSFARMWFRNLRSQGFFDGDAIREVLS